MLTDNTSLLMTCYHQQNKTQIGANIAPHLLQASWVDSQVKLHLIGSISVVTDWSNSD